MPEEPYAPRHAGERLARRRRPVEAVQAVAMIGAALGVGVLLMVVLGPGGGRYPGPDETPLASGVVAWVDRPAPSPTPSPSPTVATAPACAAGALGSPTTGRITRDLGATNIIIRIKNLSPAACRLRGYPELVGVAADGTATPLDATHGSSFGNPGPPGPIAPGKTVAVNVSGTDRCDQPLVYPTIRLVLPNGDQAEVPSRGFDTGCGVSVSKLGVPSLRPRPRPTSPLQIHVAVPASAVAGTTLTYTVTVTNAGSAAFSLEPCPSYRETLALSGVDPAGTADRTLYLNCDTVKEIAAGRSVTYAMEVPVPTVAGQAKLAWILDVPGSPMADIPVRIDAAS